MNIFLWEIHHKPHRNQAPNVEKQATQQPFMVDFWILQFLSQVWATRVWSSWALGRTENHNKRAFFTRNDQKWRCIVRYIEDNHCQ